MCDHVASTCEIITDHFFCLFLISKIITATKSEYLCVSDTSFNNFYRTTFFISSQTNVLVLRIGSCRNSVYCLFLRIRPAEHIHPEVNRNQAFRTLDKQSTIWSPFLMLFYSFFTYVQQN